MLTTAMAWALNKPAQHCQLHWVSRTIIRALTHSVLLVGMVLQSMECVIIQSTVPDRWMITASITLPPQITLRWTPLERGFTHSHFGSVSGFGLGESHFLLSYICFWDFVWHSDTWHFVYKQTCKQTQGPSAGLTYQLSFQGLASLTQLPQPDELPSCGQWRAL